jgi:predicted RNA-binding protein YlxR (DUF448 family)
MSVGRGKRQPLRTCIACGRTAPKRELARVVRTPEGEIVVDAGGKVAGRGAYICRNRHCWQTAIARRRIGHALKITLGDEDAARIMAFAEQLPDLGPSQAAADAPQGPAESE